MVYCRRCGIHLNDGVKFCPNCGTFQSGSTPINSNKRVITIGRSSSCDICLGESAEYASTYHGTIFWNGTQLMYKDTSSNGTVINNMMVHGKTVPINHGDTILVADKYQITWEKIDSLLAPSSMSYQPTRLLKLNTVTSCRKCGTKLNVGSKYCHECGTPCNSFSSQSAGESGVVEQKKSSKVPIKALLSVIIVIALLCGGWFVWENWGKDYSLEGLAKAVVSYDYINHFYEGLAYVEKDGKYGFIDKTGKEIIPCIYDYVSYFNEGLSKVKKDGKYGFIDKTGKVVIPCIYDDDVSFFDEEFLCKEKDGKYGLIDKTGKVVIPCIYDGISGFHEGITMVEKDEKWGFIDKTGKVVIPCIYDGISGFHEGLASVEIDGKYGFFDKTGKVVIPCIYDNSSGFVEGLASVKKDEKWGFIDKTGKVVIPCIYDNSSGFVEGLASVEIDGKYGFIDKTGKNVTPCIYDYFSEFHEGLAKVKKDGKIGVIDKTGKEIIPCIYDELSDFHEGIASVKKDEKHGFIDKTGKEIIPCISNYAFYFYEGLASVEKDGKYGFIDKTGKVVIPCIYDYVSEFHEGLAQVKKDGMFGFVDKKGYSTFDVENEEETDKLHWGYFLLCFLIPIVGFIYALSIRKKKPATSNQALMASLLGFVVSLILSYFMPMAISRYNEIKEAKLAREKFVKDSLEQVKLDSLYLVAQKEKEKLEAKRYEEFMEKLTFANLVSLLNNFDNVEYAKKCGLSLIYRNATKEEYGDDIEVVYGYDIEKGNKKEYGGYELIAKSNHSCYFRYVLDTSSGAKIFFKNADDANLLFERAKQYGLVIVANEYYTSYLIPNKRLPNGKSIKVEEPDYETVCGSISAPNYRDGWYIIALSQDG